MGDEGGFVPHLQSNEEAIKSIIEAVENSNLIPGKDIFIALDCAASGTIEWACFRDEGLIPQRDLGVLVAL